MLLGFVAYGLSINFYIKAQKDLGAAKTSAYYSVAPFLGVLFGVILLRERPGVQFYVGLSIMIGATVLIVKDTIALQHTHAHSHTHTHQHTHGDLMHSHEHTHVHAHTHIHGKDEKHVRRTIKNAGSYDIPLGCLIPKGMKNLTMAGRCLSSDRVAHSSARVMGTCMATGQAVGTAAALCAQRDICPTELPVQELRQILRQQGAILDGTD